MVWEVVDSSGCVCALTHVIYLRKLSRGCVQDSGGRGGRGGGVRCTMMIVDEGGCSGKDGIKKRDAGRVREKIVAGKRRPRTYTNIRIHANRNKTAHHAHARAHKHEHIHAHTHTHRNVHTHTSTYKHIHTHTHAHTHIHTYIRTRT